MKLEAYAARNAIRIDGGAQPPQPAHTRAVRYLPNGRYRFPVSELGPLVEGDVVEGELVNDALVVARGRAA